MAYSDVLNKTEEAVAAVITNLALAGLNVYTKQDDATQELPKAIVKCGEFRELHDMGLYGDYQGFVAVRICSSADGSGAKAAHTALAESVFETLNRDDLHTTATAALPDFTMIAADEKVDDHGVDERQFWSEWARNVTVCASTV